MKRIVCFLLVMSMLAMSLIGCSQKTDDEIMDDVTEAASESTVTLSMYLVSEAKVSKAVEEQIEAAVNSITKTMFKAQIDLRYYTADEYFAALDDAFLKADEEFMNMTYDDTEDESNTEEETIINENGIPELKYPTISDHQVDIFYFSGLDFYTYLDEYGYLTDLSSYTKTLNSYIFPDFMTFTKKLNGSINAIPTNHMIGEYTFLLLNKEAMSDVYYTTDDFATVSDANCQDFIDMIASEYREKYVPFYSEGDVITSVPGIKYYGTDANGNLSEDFSLIGAGFSNTVEYGTKESIINPSDLLSNSKFVEHIKAIKRYELEGYYATEEEIAANKDFAVGYINGGAEVYEKYGDKYEVIPVKLPMLTTNDIYDNMFGVGCYTSSASRCMDIITYMNTNEEFKNLILYGVEGVHYDLVESDYTDEDGNPYMAVRRKTDDNGNPLYLMANEKTGNTFIGKVLEGVDPSWTDYAKVQNREAIESLILGFTFDYGDFDYIDGSAFREQFAYVKDYTNQFLAALDACEDTDDVEKVFKDFSKQFSGDANIKSMLKNNDPKNEGIKVDPETGEEIEILVSSFMDLYRTWTVDMGLFVYEEK